MVVGRTSVSVSGGGVTVMVEEGVVVGVSGGGV